jgi:predicted tellurium resistance membrane protein TerC
MNLYLELNALLSLHGLFSLIILSLLELVLGVDNIIFISLIITKLPREKRFSARVTALSLAFVMRVIMLFCLVWLSHITTVLCVISGFEVSIRDILFFIGGGYLVYNTLKEINIHINNKAGSCGSARNNQIVYKSIIFQIVVVDMLFSFDSIFTAIGLMPNFIIMSLAVGIGMVFMMFMSGETSKFIEKHPTVKTLALCFIIVVGLLLITEALHLEIPKGYLYSGLAFALGVELLNLRLKSKT